MITITESLTNEHTLLCRLFDVIDHLLPDVRTLAEIRLLSRLIEGVLSHHADLEQNLAYAALDHAVAQKGELNRLHQDHQEIDAHLRDAALATDLAQAVPLLKAGLSASREHFSREEQTIFPLLEKLLNPATLGALGTAAAAGASPLGTHGFANALRGRLLSQAGSTLTAPATSVA